jgi:uncharacterized protein GlcG (DUF336 family)
MKKFATAAWAAGFVLFAAAAHAQVPQYGNAIDLENAKKVISAAQAEARKNSWPVAVAVVDNHGMLIAYELMDNTQTASAQVAIDKAVSSAIYRRTTKAFQDAIAGGGAGMRALNLRNASMVEGGIPLVAGGKIIGAVGVSGVNADQDGAVAKAGAEIIK